MAEREMLGEVYIPPTQCHCKDYTNIGKISFHRQDHKFIKVECPVLFCLAISIPSLSVSPYTVTPQSATLYVPNLLVTVQIALHNYACLPIVVAVIVYFIGAALSTSLSLR